MPQKFRGTVEDLKKQVMATEIPGEWKAGGSGMQTFRSEDGGILNWWPSGTIQFQGEPDASTNLEQSFNALLSTSQGDAKPCKSKESLTVPLAISRPQIIFSNDGSKSDSFMLELKAAFKRSGLIIMQLNGSKYIVTESDYDNYRSLNRIGLQLDVQKLWA